MSRLDRGQVYFVESETDRTVLLALYARVTKNGVEWFDTVRDRGLAPEEVVSDGPDVIVRGARATYRFRPLTLDLYRAKVQHRVDGQPDFDTTEDLIRFYQNLQA